MGSDRVTFNEQKRSLRRVPHPELLVHLEVPARSFNSSTIWKSKHTNNLKNKSNDGHLQAFHLPHELHLTPPTPRLHLAALALRHSFYALFPRRGGILKKQDAAALKNTRRKQVKTNGRKNILHDEIRRNSMHNRRKTSVKQNI